MTDKELIDRWSTVTSPIEALKEILEHADFLGYDPYYADLREALMQMAQRVVGASGRIMERRNEGL